MTLKRTFPTTLQRMFLTSGPAIPSLLIFLVVAFSMGSISKSIEDNTAVGQWTHNLHNIKFAWTFNSSYFILLEKKKIN